MFSIVAGCLTFVVFCFWLGLCLRHLYLRCPHESAGERVLFSCGWLGCLVVSTALLVYFILPFTFVTAVAAWLGLSLVIFCAPWQRFPKSPTPEPSFDQAPGYVIGVLLLTQICLLLLLLSGRTSEPLVSPWLLYPISIFGLFIFSTSLCAYTSIKLGLRAWPLASLQILLAVGVAAMVYGIGFGFDPFIHRAAETTLVAVGHIEPLSLLYSGQYALVAWLHFVSGLPVAVIDIWLLPLLVSLSLPLTTYVGLRYGWGVSEKVASLGWLLCLFVPFMLLTFTVPFTITYAIFIAVLCLFPLTKQMNWWILLSCLGFLSIFFHPLLGVPIFLLTFFSGWIFKARSHGQRVLAGIAFLLATMLGVPISLIIYQHQVGLPVELSNLWKNSIYFVSLFANPFTNYDPHIRLEFNLLYLWRYWQPIFLSLLAYPFLYSIRKDGHWPGAVLATFALGLLGCMYATSTLFVFKGIIQHEQQEFALRLLQATYILPIPIIALGLEKVWPKIVLRNILLTCLCLSAAVSWYFSYPQFNAKFAYYSPSVSSYDLESVAAIDTDSAGAAYVVLSNQMTSAAALQVFGFAHYYHIQNEEVLWYAIPTGGPLYDYYLKIIYGQDPNLLHLLMDETETDHVYVVMPTYWSWNADILQQLEVQSDQLIRVADKLIIYRFDRYADQD